MRADIRRETDGRLIAEGAATFFRVPEAQAAEWNGRYLGEVDIAAAAKGVES
jgi:hypothetical protein